MKRDIKINVSVLWATHSKIIAYRDAITDMETASANFLKVLESQDSKAYERLAEVWNQNVQVQESELKSRLSDIAQVLSDYIRDMESYIMPNDESQMMRVDRNDIWWNYTQIAQSATDFWDILGDTGSSWRDYDKHYWYNPFLSEEENDDRKQAQEDEEDAEQGRRERNYDKLADFRQTLSGKMTNELHEYVLAIQKIHNDNVIPFENTDDTYKTKMDDLYSEWASFWERVTDVWDVIVDVGRGLFDAVKDLVVGILSLAVGVLEVVAWLGLQCLGLGYFGLMPDFLEEDVQGIFNAVKTIFTDPGNVLEAMGQSIFDTADEEGIAYSISYVTSDIVAGILLDKGIGKLKNLNKMDEIADVAGDAGKLSDEMSEMAGDAGKVTDEMAGAADDVPTAGMGKVVANSYDEFSKAVSDIGKRTDLTDAEKVQELQKLFENSNYKADINVPSDVQYVKGFDANGNVVYDWPPKLGFDEKTITSISRTDGLPATWDRYGYMGGSNFADVPPTGKYTYSERAIPYVQNEAAYHTGAFNNASYFDKIDAIKNGDMSALNRILADEGIDAVDSSYFKNLQNSYNDFIDDAADAVGSGVDATYGLKGVAAEWGDMSGGAGQIVTPLNGTTMKRIGIIK